MFEGYDDNRLMSKVPHITCNEILSTDLDQPSQLSLYSSIKLLHFTRTENFSVRLSSCIRIYFEMALMLVTTSGLRKIAL